MSEPRKEDSPSVDERAPQPTERPVVNIGALPPAPDSPAVPEPPYPLLQHRSAEAPSGDLPSTSELTVTPEPDFADVKADSQTGNGEPEPAQEADAGEDTEEDPGPGIFDRPQIVELRCLHDIRTADGRTLVRLGWAGWGSVHAEADADGQVFHKRLWYGWPQRREIDLLVPVGATLMVKVRNLFGSDLSTLQVLPSEPALPLLVPPRAPDVIGVQMPTVKLPPFPSAAIARLMPPLPRLAVLTRRPLPSIDDRLSHAILLESRRLKRLPAWFGAGQRYQRERLMPAYTSLRVADMNIVPVRDKLHAWMVEIHHGEDDAEAG